MHVFNLDEANLSQCWDVEGADIKFGNRDVQRVIGEASLRFCFIFSGGAGVVREFVVFGFFLDALDVGDGEGDANAEVMDVRSRLGYEWRKYAHSSFPNFRVR